MHHFLSIWTHWDLSTSTETYLCGTALRVLEGSEGLPIAVQLVAPPWREELCLRAMREVEKDAGFAEQSHSVWAGADILWL